MICGKTIYESQEAASRTMAGHNRKAHAEKQKLKGSYFCKDCNGWHVHTRRKKRSRSGESWKEHRTLSVIITKDTHLEKTPGNLIIHSKMKIK